MPSWSFPAGRKDTLNMNKLVLRHKYHYKLWLYMKINNKAIKENNMKIKKNLKNLYI